MRIIIAGAGEVGFHLAKLLSYEAQDITLIDCDKENLSYADNHLDIRVIKGDATSLAVLKDANVANSDLLISVTSSETTNITVCVLAKQLGVKKTIARISNSEFIEHKDAIQFSKLGIDELISPESLAASEIESLLNESAFNERFEFEDGALTMLGLNLSRNASFVGKSVKEAAGILPKIHFVPIAIQRYGTQYTVIPRGDTIFKENDQVYFITCSGGVEELYRLSGKVKESVKDVMILGGSSIGEKTAKSLCDHKFNVKLIEKNKNRAFELADNLLGALVINADGRNVDLLDEENIDEMDAFVAVTGNSETNIMSCLMAKSKGVKRTVALVENIDYFQLSQSIGVDTLVNKKLIAANAIFRYIRKGDVVAVTQLNNLNAELLEFEVKSSSKVCNKHIKDLNFPRSAIIGGIIRGEEGLIALGDFKIQAEDKVVVCCLPRAISKVENLFL